jgi:hypothetical protein
MTIAVFIKTALHQACRCRAPAHSGEFENVSHLGIARSAGPSQVRQLVVCFVAINVSDLDIVPASAKTAPSFARRRGRIRAVP